MLSGPGPKNGEQYGAPFKEEVWADEEYDSNPVDTITPVKPAEETIPGDNVEAYAQDLSPSIDIEEFIRQLLDEPPLPQPEAPVNHDLPRAASVDHFEHLPQLCEVDYLEIDDLLGPEPLISDGEKPVEKVQFNEADELSELDLDLYHDDAMFLQDIGPIDQGMAPPPYDNMILQAGFVNNIAKQDQGDKNAGGGGWFSSSLWSFVESIPTTLASASERPLVNPTFERMSSFSKLKLNASVSAMNGSSSGGARRKRRNQGFFIISVLGALCAVLWFLTRTVRVLGKPISRLHAIITHLNNNSNNH
ncbi:hypothetical protein GQ457_13G022960 [Hibiscus cannabinus]